MFAIIFLSIGLIASLLGMGMFYVFCRVGNQSYSIAVFGMTMMLLGLALIIFAAMIM